MEHSPKETEIAASIEPAVVVFPCLASCQTLG